MAVMESWPSQVQDQRIAELRNVRENWDGDGAPAPGRLAIENAAAAFLEAKAHGLDPDEVEPDVLGGVALRFFSKRLPRWVWVSCLNNGSTSFVMSDDKNVYSGPGDTPAMWSEARSFLG